MGLETFSRMYAHYGTSSRSCDVALITLADSKSNNILRGAFRQCESGSREYLCSSALGFKWG
ncbi:hypothetical protein BDR06DRAFT_965190 [Suillus hirtellus]|nr:hypothetical protein BDR06DRAFT_965190 [Suillus hirtellus]